MWTIQSMSSRMLIITATALFYIISTVSAHMAISNPPAQAGPWSRNPSYDVHAWIGFKGKKFPCGGYPRGPVTTYNAGDVIPVRFWNFNVKDYKSFPPPKDLNQARHGGGACEFSLSFDGGKSWRVIGQYTKTCPDLYYEWPVLIPSNVPSCTNPDLCLFAWSWTAWATNQYYHHCANIVINSNNQDGKLPDLKMTIVNVPQLKQAMDTHAIGDKISTKSTGPNKKELELNINGYFANGGGAGTKGLNLGLIGNNKNPPAEDPEDSSVSAATGYRLGDRGLASSFPSGNMTDPLVQRFRVPNSATETITIDSQLDGETESRVIYWKEVQQAFQNVRYVSIGQNLISFMVDDGFNELQPRRIKFQPGVVLDVTLDTIE
ncbi:hypothetical protein BGX27_010222 [Mortierella sp. AM989]|nr:hypothetical protein BGX27_010222 [Mortierella sp. AM989]